MNDLAVWEFALKNLREGRKVALLGVLQSEGSSPGRQGFKMVLSGNGEMVGSIGGGIMEHKLVELAKKLLSQDPNQPVLKRQIHSKSAALNQSGMICSGEQTVALYFLHLKQIPQLEKLLEAIDKKEAGLLILSETELEFQPKAEQENRFTFSTRNHTVWRYTEKIPARDAVYIIGGGHVSLALSQILKILGFELHIFDDRPELNTLEENRFADYKTVAPYDSIAALIPEGDSTFVVIMTIGYRTDKDVIKQLLGKDFRYLGLLGSKAKIAQLFQELKTEGFSETDLRKVHAPIGIPIKSKTPEEIAVSIAAEIIQVKNC